MTNSVSGWTQALCLAILRVRKLTQAGCGAVAATSGSLSGSADRSRGIHGGVYQGVADPENQPADNLSICNRTQRRKKHRVSAG